MHVFFVVGNSVLNGCICRLHVSVNSGGRLDIVDALLTSNRCNADTSDVNGQRCYVFYGLLSKCSELISFSLFLLLCMSTMLVNKVDQIF